MRLTTKNIAHYLVDKGFLEPLTLANGDFVMSQTQSRNCIFHISTSIDQGLFVKQLVSMDPQNVYLMQKDATVHYLIHSAPSYSDLKKYIPSYYGYDPSKHVLVTENYPNTQNLYEYYIAQQKLSPADAQEMANILSTFHKDISDTLVRNNSLQFLNREIPWILKSNDMPALQDILFKTIQQDEVLSQNINELFQEWKGNSLIHGDIKLVNFLKINSPNTTTLKLVDWEIANIGDPLWDVAGFMQAYISFWAISVGQNQVPSNRLPSQNELWTLAAIKACTKAFWTQYVSNQNWEVTVAKIKLEKVIKYTAARLLQTAKEANVATPNQLLPPVSTLIQVAKNIFNNPAKSAEELIGISLS